MSSSSPAPVPESLDLEILRQAIQEEYTDVATNPLKGFHFHTGLPLARMLGYRDDWLDGVPFAAVASFAGTGNPFALGALHPGEHVVDVGSGAGIDSLIAARMGSSDSRSRGARTYSAARRKPPARANSGRWASTSGRANTWIKPSGRSRCDD